MRNTAAQSGVHCLVALAAMAAVAVSAAGTQAASASASASETPVHAVCQPQRPFSQQAENSETRKACVSVTPPALSRGCHQTLMHDSCGVVPVNNLHNDVAQSVFSLVTIAAKTPTPKPVVTQAPPPPAPSATPAPPAPSTVNNGVNFCAGQPIVWPSMISQWTVPQGCYGQIFSPNPANYPVRPSWGWCDWTPEEMHLAYNGSQVLSLAKHFGAPQPNAVVWFNPGVQGASSAGHWAELIAIGPNGWGLLEEMNFSWRGGGWGKIDYRFFRMYGSGVAYLYP